MSNDLFKINNYEIEINSEKLIIFNQIFDQFHIDDTNIFKKNDTTTTTTTTIEIKITSLVETFNLNIKESMKVFETDDEHMKSQKTNEIKSFIQNTIIQINEFCKTINSLMTLPETTKIIKNNIKMYINAVLSQLNENYNKLKTELEKKFTPTQIDRRSNVTVILKETISDTIKTLTGIYNIPVDQDDLNEYVNTVVVPYDVFKIEKNYLKYKLKYIKSKNI